MVLIDMQTRSGSPACPLVVLWPGLLTSLLDPQYSNLQFGDNNGPHGNIIKIKFDNLAECSVNINYYSAVPLLSWN